MWHTLTHSGVYTHHSTYSTQAHRLKGANTTPVHLHTHSPLILCCLCLTLSLTHEQRSQTCTHTQNSHTHTLTQALSRHLQCGATSEASRLSGNRSFISRLSSPHKTVLAFNSSGPKCHYCSCCRDEHMILCVCSVLFVSEGRFISYSDRLNEAAAISVPPPPAFFVSACHFSESQCLTKQKQNSVLLNRAASL